VLKGCQFRLDEIPLFAQAGAVVPTQTMQKAEGPLIWILFPGNGTGAHYEDDGTSTKYQSNTASDAFSWTNLTHATNAKTAMISITGQPASASPRRHVLQLRRLAGDQGPPTGVECNSQPLSKVAPPSPGTMGAVTGWWVAPAAEDSLWLAGGSLMISLPLSASDASVLVRH